MPTAKSTIRLRFHSVSLRHTYTFAYGETYEREVSFQCCVFRLRYPWGIGFELLWDLGKQTSKQHDSKLFNVRLRRSSRPPPKTLFNVGRFRHATVQRPLARSPMPPPARGEDHHRALERAIRRWRPLRRPRPAPPLVWRQAVRPRLCRWQLSRGRSGS